MRSRATFAFALVLASAQLPLVSHAGSRPPVGGIALEQAVDRALEHVRAHRAELGLSAADVADIMVTDAYRSAQSGVRHVYLRQRLDGLEVLGANMTLGVSRDGRVFHVGSRFLSGLEPAASGRADRDALRAVRDAATHLGLEVTALSILRAPVGRARETLLSPAGISLSPIPAKLVYQPLADGRLRVAWNLEIEERLGLHWWNVSVDAQTGDVLAVLDYTDHDDAEATAAAIARTRREGPSASDASGGATSDGASYRVYALPLESPNDGSRTLASDPADAIASPFGWHDYDGAPGHEFTTTQGNSVHAYADLSGASVAVPGLDADGGPNLVFDFPLDLSQPPVAYKDAAITNLFYWNNIIHDVFFRYGFDEVSGNFQENNYSLEGLGSDYVRAEGQDSAGVNNANFATPADGNNPRMQMYLWPSTAQRKIRDGDLDAGVVIHEYAHGISNRLTGGPNTTGCLSVAEQGGEGWSDFLAIALTARAGDKGTDRRGMGTYVSGQSTRTGAGIRPRPYSTKMSVNGATYDSVKSAAVPHGVGWVWATMLWEVYWDLVATHGFNPDPYGDWTTGGNNLALQLVLDGMKLQPCRPGFVDARDAIVAADLALTGGVNRCIVWQGFAKRGLGFSADQVSSSSVTDGVEAFDMPPDCV